MKYRKISILVLAVVLIMLLLLSACTGTPSLGGAVGADGTASTNSTVAVDSTAVIDETAAADSTVAESTQSSTVGESETAAASVTITAQEAKALMDAGGVVVVDVRRPDEYAAGHIPGAINIPNENISDTRPEELADTDAALIVYCRTGVRSAAAASKLTAMGYTNVSDMGGFVDWSYATVSGSESGVYNRAG